MCAPFLAIHLICYSKVLRNNCIYLDFIIITYYYWHRTGALRSSEELSRAERLSEESTFTDGRCVDTTDTELRRIY